jgi:hypothetical protein
MPRQVDIILGPFRQPTRKPRDGEHDSAGIRSTSPMIAFRAKARMTSSKCSGLEAFLAFHHRRR